MLTALLLLVLALAFGVLVLILLAIVVVGIRREPPTAELSSRPPSPISAMARRLIGVYVRKPDPTDGASRQQDPWFTGHRADGESR
jgi:hypothetical protein